MVEGMNELEARRKEEGRVYSRIPVEFPPPSPRLAFVHFVGGSVGSGKSIGASVANLP